MAFELAEVGGLAALTALEPMSEKSKLASGPKYETRMTIGIRMIRFVITRYSSFVIHVRVLVSAVPVGQGVALDLGV